MGPWAVGAVLLAGAVHAQTESDLDTLQTALLNEAAYGNHDEAIRGYLSLVRKLPADDPLRAEALFHLAAANYALGRLDEAREPLIDANRTGVCGTRCQLLLGRIDLERGSVRTLPVRWDFSTVDHGLFHPWEYEDKGGIRVQSTDEAANPALIWRTVVDVNKGDRLVVGFEHPAPAPRRVRFRIQAERHPAWIRVRIVDDLGRSYVPATDPIRVDADRPTRVDLDLSALVPVPPSTAPLDRATVSRLYIEDVSAQAGSPPGEHRLYLDDFEIL